MISVQHMWPYKVGGFQWNVWPSVFRFYGVKYCIGCWKTYRVSTLSPLNKGCLL